MRAGDKLVSLLTALSPGEIKRFRQFVSSPFFGNNKDALHFLDELITGKEKRLTSEGAFRRLYGDKAYRKQQLYDLTSALYRLLEDYLSYCHYSNNKKMQRHDLLCELRKRKLHHHFTITQKSIAALMDRDAHRDGDHYLAAHLIEGEIDDFLMQQEARGGMGRLQEKVDSLDHYYMATKLKDCCEMINRKNVLQVNYDLHFIDEVCDHIARVPERFENEPAIMIYYSIYQTLTDSANESHYIRLVQLLKKHVDRFPTEEARGLYQYAQNYCIKQINSGKSEYLEHLFGLHQTILDTRVVFDGKYITEWDYRNIITVALRLKKFRWAGEFIKSYKNALHPDARNNAYYLNLAAFYYEQQNHSQALRLLQGVTFNDVYYDLAARSMMMKIYYEREDTETLFSLVNAFKIYLKRNRRISSYQFHGHWNLIRFVMKAMRLRLARPKKVTKAFSQKVNDLKRQIAGTPVVVNIDWLNAQVHLLTV